LLANLLFSEKFSFAKGDSVVVIGLGRFGGSVAQSLMRLGHDVMGIDRDAAPVHEWADLLTHAVQADSTNLQVLRQLGVADFAHAIVGIGTDLAASLLTIMTLTELGMGQGPHRRAWADSPAHWRPSCGLPGEGNGRAGCSPDYRADDRFH
jgi:trk system potassium uptake protein TrkA